MIILASTCAIITDIETSRDICIPTHNSHLSNAAWNLAKNMFAKKKKRRQNFS
jgi:hypothetical protein